MDTGPLFVSRWARQAWKPALVLAVIGGGLWTAIHGVAGVAWNDVTAVLRQLGPHQVVWLSLIWLGGLGIYATVLSAALPGLGIRRSLLLNLSGSAVANLIPLGGAVATGLNWKMVRTWGHSNVAFAAYCVLTNVLDVSAKLLLPVVAVAGLSIASLHVPAALWAIAAACGGVLVLAGIAQGVAAHARPGRRNRVVRHLQAVTVSTRRLLWARWPRLVPASVGYVAAQVLLLVVSLRAVGLAAPLAVVLMAAAIERLSTVVPLTPGGAGVAEIGTIAWLVANGLNPVEVVAGVLLYRIVLIAMEIPVGGLLLCGWMFLQRHTPRSPGTSGLPA